MKKKKVLLVILVMLWLSGIRAFAATVIPTDVTAPSSGCTLLGIEGKYIAQIPQALQRINEIRKEACQEGVRNPATGRPLAPADYKPIKWSSDLEYIARIRAAEASLTMDHVRTNGSSCFAIQSPRSVYSMGEVIAWNWGETMVGGINQWYSEKTDWVNQVPNAVTGHYTQMINPNNLYIGLGTFCTETSIYYNTTVGEFSPYTGLDESQGTGIANCIQVLEVNNSYLAGNYTITGTTSGKRGDRIQLNLTTSMKVTDYWGNALSTSGLLVMSPVSWNSSNPEIASVNSNGIVTANTCGNVQITAQDKAGHMGTHSFQVGHIESLDNAVAATCTTEGKTAGSHCSVCNTVLAAQKVVPALGHSFTKYKSNGDATMLQNGTKTAKCDRCNVINTIEDIGSRLTPTIKVTASRLLLKVGQKITAFKVTDMVAGDYVKSWESNKPSVVKVSGKSNGTCTITAQKKTGSAEITIIMASGATKKVAVTVQQKAVETTKISGLPKKLTLENGKKAALKPVITPITSLQKVTYKTSNKKVATVSSKGVVTAKGAGTAKITVQSGKKKVTVTVTVPKAKTTAIKNVPAAKTLKVGKSYTIKAKLVPSNSGEKITYMSSNKKVAAVNSKGKITGKKKGTAVITVKSGKIAVKCKVTVK